ncbi:prepilin peptidase [Parablastomonas sp. CN1-191]|uniref:prepilin peptidase n=1 Tax=Parablastomonas sp. CN1-191 TaxID=3400908 RepID=UPI003BF7ED46
MNVPFGAAAYGLLAGLAIALLVAAFTDLRRRQIDNGLNALVALAAPLYWWAAGLGWSGAAIQVALAVGAMAVFTLLFARGLMGGGDVKLLAALALWLPPLSYFQLLFMMAIVGGAMSIVAGARNLDLAPEETGKRRLAVIAAALWLLLTVYVVRVMNGAAPVDFGALGAPLGAIGAVLVPCLLIAVFGVLLSGARVIARRQKSKLPVPYGLAISVAGLWLLATHPEQLVAAAGPVIG